MKVLILGGTAEARELAGTLDCEVISSLAGRVKNPLLPVGEVRIGGFGGVHGLRDWIRENSIDAVIDATHPFAANISANAAAACDEVPLLALRRPGWVLEPGWISAPSLAAVAGCLPGHRVFLAIGRQGVHHFADDAEHWFLIRAIDAPEGPMPPHCEVVLARGPFTLEGDLELMRSRRIDVVVAKNSGGLVGSSKLDAARELGIPVVLVERPPVPGGVAVCSTVEAAQTWLSERASH